MKTEAIYGIYGASGCGRGIAPLLEKELCGLSGVHLVFIDDGCTQSVINGLPRWNYEQFIQAPISRKLVSIAIADTVIREKLVNKCAQDNLIFQSIVSEQHVRMKNVAVGEGAIFSPYTVMTSNIEIGRHFHCNIGSYVEHDCKIGDFVTFAPSVRCNGNVHIEDHVYIGAGAMIKQGSLDKPLRIGRGAVVGMGAVVTKDVPADAVVVGNPARVLE